VLTDRRLRTNRRRRLLLTPTASTSLADLTGDGYDIGADGANAIYNYTDGSGGNGGTGLTPILDVISNTNRRFGGCSVSPDGTKAVALSYDGIIASFELSTPYDLSTATQTGTSKPSLGTLCSAPMFTGAGNYVTYHASNDTFYLLALATPYEVASTDTVTSSATEAQIMGYSASTDPIHTLSEDGTGIWSYGRVDVSTYTLTWTPLSVAYDLTSYGTVEHNSTNYTNVPGGPSGGSMIAQDDGTRIHIFDGGTSDAMQQFDVAAFDPASGNTRTEDTSFDITQDSVIASWSKDFSHVYLSGAFTSAGRCDVYGVV